MRKMQLIAVSIGLLFVIVGCEKSTQTVKAGCALCIYEMEGVSGCELAVKVDGKAHLVSGIEMDDLGDAHAEDGLCSMERQVKAAGKVEGDRFVATKIELLPQK